MEKCRIKKILLLFCFAMCSSLSDAQIQSCGNRYLRDESKTIHFINLNIGYNNIYKNENNFWGQSNAISIGLAYECQKHNSWYTKLKYTNFGFATNTQMGTTSTYSPSYKKYTINGLLSQYLLSTSIGLINYVANNQFVQIGISGDMLLVMSNQDTTVIYYEEGELKEIYSNSSNDVCVGLKDMYKYHITDNLSIGIESYDG